MKAYEIAMLMIVLASFTSFTMYVGSKYGIQKSISASIHVLPGWEKMLYSFFVLGISIPLMIFIGTPLGFAAGAFLAFDFAAPSGGPKMQMTVHIIGADVGMALGLLLLAVTGQWVILVLGLLAVVGVYLFTVNRIWWVETVIFITVFLGVIVEKLS